MYEIEEEGEGERSGETTDEDCWLRMACRRTDGLLFEHERYGFPQAWDSRKPFRSGSKGKRGYVRTSDEGRVVTCSLGDHCYDGQR